jgi:YidC/Oxa1 family membrane protein insertase
MGFLGDIGSAIMTPLYYGVSAILLGWHWVFDRLLPADSGWTWVLAIVGLTVTIRALLIPLFVKQIKSSRNMQLLQPQIKELQKKYGHDRERLTQEQMKLWKETGTNPFASCLPLLLQMPIFFALFRVIDQSAKLGAKGAKGFLTGGDAESLSNARFLGAKIADTFVNTSVVETRILTMALVIIMCITQFTTQRQLMSKNMPPDAMNGPYAQQQKMLLYILPVVFAVGGVAFPLGVLFYWTTSNLWTMGQQFYVIRNNPAPGTPAFKAKQERDARHGKTVVEDPLKDLEEAHEQPPPRQQPKKQSRSERKKSGTDGAPKEQPEAQENTPRPKPPPRQQPKNQSRNKRKKKKGKR